MKRRAFALAVSCLALAGTSIGLWTSGAGADVPPAPYGGPPSTVGTEFWTAFGINYPGETTFDIDLSGNTATTATVAVPGIGFSQDVSVTPGQVTAVPVTGAEVMQADGVQDLGIHVTAAAPISVYGLEDQVFSTDGFTALPVTAIGTTYYALGWDGGDPSDFQVVGTKDGTTVTITPSAATSSHPAGVPYTVQLDAGQVYQLLGQVGNDLSGTEITATAPVSVLAGSECANIPDGYSFCNYVAEQMPPTSEWGTDFVTEPLATRTKGDTFRMLADTAGTTLTINGTQVATLGAGQFFQTQLTEASVIHSSSPILVAQYSDSTSYDGAPDADPSETLVPPDEQFLNSYTVATAPDTRFTNYLNVVAPTSEVGSVTLDGAALPSSDFSPIGGSTFSGAQIPVGTGSHTVDAPLSFGLWVYGFGVTDAYSEPGGYGAGAVANATSLSLSPSTQDVAPGQQACVTATVEDQGGDPLPGIGVTFVVTGANPDNGFVSTDAGGHARFCYAATNAGTDAVTASSGSLTAAATVDVAATSPIPVPPPAGHSAIGYRLQGKDGGVFDFGQSQFYGSLPQIMVAAPIVATANTYDNGGYWLAGSNGTVYAFGDAPYLGGLAASSLVSPIVGIAGTPDRGGYWLVASDGAVYAFGDAPYLGGMSGGTLQAPIVGIAATPSGEGYWLVGGDGGVYAFGDADFVGSMGGRSINAPVVGLAPSHDGKGYWLVGADGGVYAFGDAPFEGSEGGQQLVAPVVGMVGDPSGGGYWLMAADGGVFAFGDAPYLGAASDPTMVPHPLNAPVTSAST